MTKRAGRIGRKANGNGGLVASTPRGGWRGKTRDVMLRNPGRTTATPAYAIGQMISDALDPTQAPGKVRTMADMTPEELAKLTPPRKK